MQVFTNMRQCIPIINFLSCLSKREIHENQFSAKMKSFTVDGQYSSLDDSFKTKKIGVHFQYKKCSKPCLTSLE